MLNDHAWGNIMQHGILLEPSCFGSILIGALVAKLEAVTICSLWAYQYVYPSQILVVIKWLYTLLFICCEHICELITWKVEKFTMSCFVINIYSTSFFKTWKHSYVFLKKSHTLVSGTSRTVLGWCLETRVRSQDL